MHHLKRFWLFVVLSSFFVFVGGIQLALQVVDFIGLFVVSKGLAGSIVALLTLLLLFFVFFIIKSHF